MLDGYGRVGTDLKRRDPPAVALRSDICGEERKNFERPWAFVADFQRPWAIGERLLEFEGVTTTFTRFIQNQGGRGRNYDGNIRKNFCSTLKIKDELIKESKSVVKTKDLCEKYGVNKYCFQNLLVT